MALAYAEEDSISLPEQQFYLQCRHSMELLDTA